MIILVRHVDNSSQSKNSPGRLVLKTPVAARVGVDLAEHCKVALTMNMAVSLAQYDQLFVIYSNVYL